MTNPICLIMTGQIRDPIELSVICHKVVSWRKAGVLGRVIFSGWKAEEAGDAESIQALRRLGFDVVLCDPAKESGPGFAWTQKKMLQEALRTCDPDWLCIKIRTDKSSPLIDRMVEHVAARAANMEAERANRPAGGFAAKVSVFNLVSNWPFSHSDYVFAGLVRDLRRMCRSDASTLASTGALAVAEVDWYYTGLAGLSPEIDDFMFDLDHQTFAKKLVGHSFTEAEAEDFRTIFPFYARTMLLMAEQFVIASDWPAVLERSGAKLGHVLLGDPDLPDRRHGMAHVGPKVKVSNQHLLELIVADEAVASLRDAPLDITKPEVRAAFDRLSGPAKRSNWRKSPAKFLAATPDAAEAGDGALDELLASGSRKLYAEHADKVLGHLPATEELLRDIASKPPEPYVLMRAQAMISQGQERKLSDQVRAGVLLLLTLSNKRYPAAFWALLRVEGLENYVDPETFTRTCLRVEPYDTKIMPYIRNRAANDAAFPFRMSGSS